MVEKSRNEVRVENTTAFKSMTKDGTVEIFCLLRRYMEHEDTLVHQRTSWFLTLNSFLFASVAIVLASDSNTMAFSKYEITLFLLLVALVGFVSSVATIAGVLAAYNSTKALKDIWIDKYEPLSKDFGLVENHRGVGLYDFEDNPNFSENTKRRFRHDPMRPMPYIKGGGGRYGNAKRGRYVANGIPVMIGLAWVAIFVFFGWTILPPRV